MANIGLIKQIKRMLLVAKTAMPIIVSKILHCFLLYVVLS